MRNLTQLNFRAPSGRQISIDVADSFISRFKGLMGRKEGNYGLLLISCNSIHTCFMRYPLDILFLNDENQVVAIKRGVRPFHLVMPVKGATKALEFPSSLHASAFVKVGDILNFY